MKLVISRCHRLMGADRSFNKLHTTLSKDKQTVDNINQYPENIFIKTNISINVFLIYRLVKFDLDFIKYLCPQSIYNLFLFELNIIRNVLFLSYRKNK